MSLWHFHLPKEKTRLTEVNDCSQVEQVTCDRERPGNRGAGAPCPQPRRAVWAQRKGPREGDPQGPQQSAVEAEISDTPFPSVLFESVPVISIAEVRLPKILRFKYFTGWYCLLQTVLSTQSWMCREERGGLGAENQTALPVPHCPGGVGLSWGGRVMLLAPQWAEIWASPQHRPAWQDWTHSERWTSPWELAAHDLFK